MTAKLYPSFEPTSDILIQEGGSQNIVWFVDYTSPETRRLRDMLQRSVHRFDELSFSFAVRFFPDGKRGPSSEIAARAAIAAHQQNQFLDMHRALFAAGPEYTEAGVQNIARDLGLDLSRFIEAFESEETTKRLKRDGISAEQSAPVPHRPMLFIDGQLYTGVWDDNSLLEAIQKPLGVRLHLASTAFFHWAAAAGLVLVLSTFAALVFVNLGGAELYESIRQSPFGIRFGSFQFELPFEIWVNDGLMALFFLVVGIEIKREFLDGELSDPARASLPLIGALGGMVVPVLIYLLITRGTPAANGWGVPMATDIAFTLGILALLGNRVPTSLKVFVSALAIADDLGAILVIAIFYGHGFHMDAFLAACLIFTVMLGLNFGRVYARLPYMLLGVVMWYFVHASGLHATLAGVLTAAAIPSRKSASIEGTMMQVNKVLKHEASQPETPPGARSVQYLQAIVDRMRDPGFHLQRKLENWNNFLILPLFAFVNTGIVFAGSGFSLDQAAVVGTILGLIAGKTLGIFGFVWISVRLGVAKLSAEISWLQLLGASNLCGIGFTMSIFIASAAFEAQLLASVKLAILIASILAAILGTIILLSATKPTKGTETKPESREHFEA